MSLRAFHGTVLFYLETEEPKVFLPKVGPRVTLPLQQVYKRVGKTKRLSVTEIKSNNECVPFTRES